MWSAASLVVVAALGAACGGDGDAAVPVNTVGSGADASAMPTTTMPHTVMTPSTTTTPPTTTFSASTSTTTSTTTTTTTTAAVVLSDEQQILDVIERYWWTVGNAFDPPEPNAELWLDVATYENTLRRHERQQARLEAGEGVRTLTPDGPFLIGGVVTSLSSESAVAFVCVIDDAVLFDLETDFRLAAAAQINLNRTELKFDAGNWLVHDSQQDDWFDRDEGAECIEALPAS